MGNRRLLARNRLGGCLCISHRLTHGPANEEIKGFLVELGKVKEFAALEVQFTVKVTLDEAELSTEAGNHEDLVDC